MTAALERMFEFLRDAAHREGLPFLQRADLASTTFRGIDENAQGIDPIDLPQDVMGISLGRCPIVLGELPAAPDGRLLQAAMRRYRNQAVVARSFLQPSQTCDLHLILAAPSGALHVDEWQQEAGAIERDERVCRKLVWLRSADPAQDEATFLSLLDRTFLARPWRQSSASASAELDHLSRFVATGAGSGLASRVVSEWIALGRLTDEEHDNDALVLELVSAYQRGTP